jgi:hypothetical protein
MELVISMPKAGIFFRKSSMTCKKHDSGRLKHPEFSYFKLDTGVVNQRVGQWTAFPLKVNHELPNCQYLKISHNPFWDSWSNSNRSDDNKPASPPPRDHSGRLPSTDALSIEEARKISQDIIHTFSDCPMLKELLEDAVFFAGPSIFSGALTIRKARAAITRYEASF